MTKILLTLMISLATGCASAGDGKPPPGAMAPPQRIPNPQLGEIPAGTHVATSAIPRDIRRAVVAAAARRFGVAESAVVLTRAEQVTWPDASLGCPTPGQVYTQAMVPGFRVVARTPSGEFVFNTDSQSTVRNCPLPEGLAPAPPER